MFSDDVAWAQEHLDTAGLPAVFMPPGAAAVGDLALMELCQGLRGEQLHLQLVGAIPS